MLGLILLGLLPVLPAGPAGPACQKGSPGLSLLAHKRQLHKSAQPAQPGPPETAGDIFFPSYNSPSIVASFRLMRVLNKVRDQMVAITKQLSAMKKTVASITRPVPLLVPMWVVNALVLREIACIPHPWL